MWKPILAIVLLIVIIFGGSAWLVDVVFKHDMRAAEKYCAQYGAVPSYTYRTRYICVTPDGRVVG